jgi:branched-subunit amino acid ABC-type transport system permease component
LGAKLISQVILNGFVTGMIIAPPAIALTLTYGILKFPNFAIGAMLTVGAYLAFIGNKWFQMPLPAAAVLAAACLVVICVGVDRLVFQPLRERTAVTLLVASMGVSFVLENVTRFAFGNSARSFEVPIARPLRLFDLRINAEQIYTAATALCAMLAVYIILRHTSLGRAMRAVSDNPALAAVRGIERERVVRWMWVIAGVLTAAAGVLAALDRAIDPKAMISRKWKTVSILAQQNPFVIPMIEPAKKEFEKAGVKVLDSVVYNPDQPSYRAEVQRIFGASSAAEVGMCLGLLTDFVSIVREVVRNDYKSKMMALSIMADAEGQFIQSVGAETAEGIEHFQPAPPLGSPSYARFQKLMGADENALFLFAGNTHDQICTLALAMEKTKSTDSLVYSKAIRELCNGPGQKVDNIGESLKLVRAGTKIDFVGAGSDCDFDERGDQLNRHFGHFRIEKGKQALVQIIKGPEVNL